MRLLWNGHLAWAFDVSSRKEAQERESERGNSYLHTQHIEKLFWHKRPHLLRDVGLAVEAHNL